MIAWKQATTDDLLIGIMIRRSETVTVRDGLLVGLFKIPRALDQASVGPYQIS